MPETVTLIEDALKIRLSEPEQRQLVTSKSLRDLIEGLNLFGNSNKKLDSSLQRMLKEGSHLNEDPKLTVWAVHYFADFEIKVDPAL